jgi:hypothetical protein
MTIPAEDTATAHAEEIIELSADWPGWRFWRTRGGNGRPGTVMATRRRDLTDAELYAGLAVTLPMGYDGDLRKQLHIQSLREEALGRGAI